MPEQMYALEQDIIGAWEEPLLCLNPLIQIAWQCLIKAHSTTAAVGVAVIKGEIEAVNDLPKLHLQSEIEIRALGHRSCKP